MPLVALGIGGPPGVALRFRGATFASSVSSYVGFKSYVFISMLLAVGVVVAEFSERPNYYSTMVAIACSPPQLLAVLNMVLAILIVAGRFLIWCLFGRLLTWEVSNLSEQLRYELAETVLTLTVFKGEYTFQFGICFSLMVLLKVFNWIAVSRADSIFQTNEVVPHLRKIIRLGVALAVLVATDVAALTYCIKSLVADGPGTIILFAFEFALLQNSFCYTVGKFALNLYEAIYVSRNDGDPWESKNVSSLSLSIITGALRMGIYGAFLVVMIRPYGVPLYLCRDVYVTFTDLVSKISGYWKSQKVKSILESNFYGASAADVERDNICIICREVMDINATNRLVPKRLHCGHVIHHGCLKSWLNMSQNCPTCRLPVISSDSQARQGQQHQHQHQQDPGVARTADQEHFGTNLPSRLRGFLRSDTPLSTTITQNNSFSTGTQDESEQISGYPAETRDMEQESGGIDTDIRHDTESDRDLQYFGTSAPEGGPSFQRPLYRVLLPPNQRIPSGFVAFEATKPKPPEEGSAFHEQRDTDYYKYHQIVINDSCVGLMNMNVRYGPTVHRGAAQAYHGSRNQQQRETAEDAAQLPDTALFS